MNKQMALVLFGIGLALPVMAQTNKSGPTIEVTKIVKTAEGPASAELPLSIGATRANALLKGNLFLMNESKLDQAAGEKVNLKISSNESELMELSQKKYCNTPSTKGLEYEFVVQNAGQSSDLLRAPLKNHVGPTKAIRYKTAQGWRSLNCQ